MGLSQLLMNQFDMASILNHIYSFLCVVNTSCWKRDNVEALKRLEANLSNINNFIKILDECNDLLESCGVKYKPIEDGCIEIDLTINRKDGNGIFEIKETLEPGKQYRIVGPNGSGKSTLFAIIKSKMMPQLASGSIGISSDQVSVQPQEPYIINDEATLLEQFLYPQTIYNYPDIQRATNLSIELAKKLNFFNSEITDDAALSKKIVSEKRNYEIGPQRLSGGQKLKLQTIRTILNKGKLHCFDEPTAALDESSQEIFRSIIKEYLSDVPVLHTHHNGKSALPEGHKGPIAIIEAPLSFDKSPNF